MEATIMGVIGCSIGSMIRSDTIQITPEIDEF